jgi:hypothetical protein
VVDRCAAEAPHTLLLAEAFWMMEGYFVRTLGMHRVYNSAFMNMLKKEENDKYRQTIKNTLAFDSEVLKRFVNFMNNPDEETAVAQFGKGDKYFGICTLLVTMPGLPMFGHGQIEGFEEKYGMEYRRSYRDEEPDEGFIGRHEREIFPLMKRRPLFSGASSFFLYDFYQATGGVNENVYAYTNRSGNEHALVVFNNSYESGAGWVNASAVAVPQKNGTMRQDKLAEALSLRYDEQYFTLLRETRSGLWFLRNSKDLHEHGLFVMLRGYEAQVYLDIQEICDDEHGYWARLHRELGGSGVENPEDAVEDLAFGPLYAAFNDALTADAENDALATAVAHFITEAQRVLAEEDAEADIDMAENADTAKTAKKTKAAKKTADADKPVPADAEKTAEEIAALIKKTETKYAPNAEKAAEPFFARAYLVMTSLRALFGDKASGEKAAKLARDWHLARKIREAAASLPSFDRNIAAHAAETAIAVLARSTPPKPWTAAGIFTENRDQPDFHDLLGLNVFDNIVWYNKERFALTFCYAAFYASLEKNAQPETVARIVREITAADKKVEYRLDNLIAQLSPKAKAAR